MNKQNTRLTLFKVFPISNGSNDGVLFYGISMLSLSVYQELCLHTKLLAPITCPIADFLAKAPEPPPIHIVRNAVQMLKVTTSTLCCVWPIDYLLFWFLAEVANQLKPVMIKSTLGHHFISIGYDWSQFMIKVIIKQRSNRQGSINVFVYFFTLCNMAWIASNECTHNQTRRGNDLTSAIKFILINTVLCRRIGMSLF